MSEESHRIWGAGVGGWVTRKDWRLNYREKFWVAKVLMLLSKIDWDRGNYSNDVM